MLLNLNFNSYKKQMTLVYRLEQSLFEEIISVQKKRNSIYRFFPTQNVNSTRILIKEQF